MKLDGDDFGLDSDADSDSDSYDSYKSASSSSDGDGNNSLASPSSANALPSEKEETSSSNYKKAKVMADMDDYEQMLTSLMQDSIKNQSQPVTTQPKAGAQTSFSINY